MDPSWVGFRLFQMSWTHSSAQPCSAGWAETWRQSFVLWTLVSPWKKVQQVQQCAVQKAEKRVDWLNIWGPEPLWSRIWPPRCFDLAFDARKDFTRGDNDADAPYQERWRLKSLQLANPSKIPQSNPNSPTAREISKISPLLAFWLQIGYKSGGVTGLTKVAHPPWNRSVKLGRGWAVFCQVTDTIHGTGIFTYIDPMKINQNSWIGKYTATHGSVIFFLVRRKSWEFLEKATTRWFKPPWPSLEVTNFTFPKGHVNSPSQKGHDRRIARNWVFLHPLYNPDKPRVLSCLLLMAHGGSNVPDIDWKDWKLGPQFFSINGP